MNSLESQLSALYEQIKALKGENHKFEQSSSQKTRPLFVLPLIALSYRNFGENLLIEKLGNIPGINNAIHYPIAELVTNIFEHSKSDLGFLFAYYDQDNEYLDLCIVDCGCGLAKTYQEEQDLKLSDTDAILEVLKGHSTKSNIERGYGVRTSKRVVCEGLGGSFVMISGNTALHAEKGHERLIELPDFYWQGVIVAYRVQKPIGPVEIAQYLE